jgi:phenylpropionate dioxygenase-like ring-hydroxylating dioxygenase large terminal subunit
MTTTLGGSLGQTYGAYNSRRDLKEDAELTHVGRGTPGGELLRRYWQPVANAAEMTDGLPLKLRILGEDLVLFRTNKGEYGLVEQRCSHRGASLEYGVISDAGIRCAYHGFHYAPDGTILETGSGAPMANAGKLCHGAYPVHVFHDLIFAYMGPPELKPVFPMLDLYVNPNITVENGHKRTGILDCNWLQITENGQDPIHTAWLHSITTGTQRGFSDEMAIIPVMQWVMNETGMHYIASRRKGDLVWVRVLHRFGPNTGLIPPDDERMTKPDTSQYPFVQTWVTPIDDTNSKRLYIMFNDHRNPLKPGHYERGYAQAKDRTYEEMQRYPGDYEAMASQGPIAVHAYENLTSTDYGVIAVRNLFREGIRAVQEGKDPICIIREEGHVIRTRAQNTVLRVPPAATPEEDVALLKKVGRDVADGNLLNTLPPL